MPEHVVTQGECLSSIAARYGFADHRKIWEHPNNAELRELRPDPNLLFVGDVVFVPDRAPHTAHVMTGREHVFTLHRPKIVLELALKFDGEALANKPYVLVLGAERRSGVTDANGRLKEPIEPTIERAQLQLEEPIVEWDLHVGHLDPATEVSGVQARLNNLGHACGSIDEHVGPRTRAALRQFQARNQLEPTGEIDATTLAALQEAHDLG
jgi:N-acetylmuramoyl-L-alanine amidase